MEPTLPSGPGLLSFARKEAMTEEHLEKYAKYLHVILSCPALLMKKELYEIFNIRDTEIIVLFQILATQKMEQLTNMANRYKDDLIRIPAKLKQKSFKFHTLWIVKPPLKNISAKFAVDQWCLKFEGIIYVCSCFNIHQSCYFLCLKVTIN